MRKLRIVLGLLCAAWLVDATSGLGDAALRAMGTQTAPAQQAAWGSEALADVATGLHFPFIQVANACGLGTSSCARCHDGRRAPAPTAGSDGPWHRDHARVSYSCTGCHAGNPRVMRQDVAHNKMVAKPLQSPELHCKACHKADGAALARRYAANPTSTP